MMPPSPIPQFLLPRGGPSRRTLLHLLSRRASPHQPYFPRYASTTNDPSKPRVLEKPDKFRPPSHPARRVLPTRDGRVVNYPGPRLSEEEKREKAQKHYPHMFPPEGSVTHKFLTNRGIHVWIAFGVLTSLAVFTFTTSFKASSPFTHLLPPWSALFTNPISALSQAISVYKMDVEHKTIEAEEKRLQRFGDAYKRHQFRAAHGIKDGPEFGPDAGVFVDEGRGRKKAFPGREGLVLERQQDQRPPQPQPQRQEQEPEPEQGQGQGEEYIDFEGKRRPVKKWLGIW